MLRRSIEALVSRAVFFRKYNDIDIYTEDASPETRKFVATLLSQAGRGEVQLQYVFPLGSKSDVIRACISDTKLGGRRRAYLVDGDFDAVVSTWVEVPRLFVAPRYCIENFLIEAEAAACVLAANSQTMTKRDAEAALDFNGWVGRNAPPLRDLYIAYMVAKIISPSVRTVAAPLRELLSDDSGVVDAAKVAAKIAVIDAHMLAASDRDEIDSWTAFVRGRCTDDPRRFLLTHVSGKDVLLPLLRMRMSRIERLTKPPGLFKIEMAGSCKPTPLSNLFKVAAA